VHDGPRSSQPKMQRTDENVDREGNLVRSDRRLDVRLIRILYRDGGTCWELTDSDT
jgi:hypothetical protein